MPKIQCEVHHCYSKIPPKLNGLGDHEQTWNCWVVFFAPGTTINGMKYVQMLQEKRNIYMVIHNTSICMHEAPCHRSKVVSKHLRKSKVKDLLPGRSPDLNPIENLWSYIKNKVAEKQPSTGKKLVTAIKEVWVKEISTEYCASLIKVCLAVLLQ